MQMFYTGMTVTDAIVLLEDTYKNYNVQVVDQGYSSKPTDKQIFVHVNDNYEVVRIATKHVQFPLGGARARSERENPLFTTQPFKSASTQLRI